MKSKHIDRCTRYSDEIEDKILYIEKNHDKRRIS